MVVGLREGGSMPLWKLILNSKLQYDSTRLLDKTYGFLGLVSKHVDGTSPTLNIADIQLICFGLRCLSRERSRMTSRNADYLGRTLLGVDSRGST